MALFFYKWSRTASSNASADANINFAEGQAPSSVNDSARALMASAAGYRDDISGAIVTGGTSTSYTIASYQIFDSLANMNGAMIAFTPHTANGATVTLNVDSLGYKPLRPSTGVELQSNSLIAGTPYMATYNSLDAVWYLHGLGGNTYGVPLGAGMDFWLATAPSSAFAFPTGQAISRTTYATLFAAMGTTYGVGDGSTTFNLPDKTGRVSAMKEATATRLTTAGGGVDGATMGSAAGAQTHTLTTAQLASHTHTGTTGNDSPDHTHSQTDPAALVNVAQGSSTVWTQIWQGTNPVSTAGASVRHTHAFTTDASGSGTAHPNVQPTIVCNYILRII